MSQCSLLLCAADQLQESKKSKMTQRTECAFVVGPVAADLGPEREAHAAPEELLRECPGRRLRRMRRSAYRRTP